MDKTVKGLLAGMLAGVPMNIWSLLSYYLGLGKFRLLDWGSFMFFGNPAANILEAIFGQVAQLLWVGFLGIVFIYLIQGISSRHLYLKGAFFGYITGFIIYALPILLQTPVLSNLSIDTVISNSVSGIIWGVSLGYITKYLEHRIS